jgi:hypothetical protein
MWILKYSARPATIGPGQSNMVRSLPLSKSLPIQLYLFQLDTPGDHPNSMEQPIGSFILSNFYSSINVSRLGHVCPKLNNNIYVVGFQHRVATRCLPRADVVVAGLNLCGPSGFETVL